MISSEQRAQARAEDLERATAEATSCIQAHYEDPDVWVRFVVSEGTGNEMIYHFDVFGPRMVEQPQVIVTHAGADVWEVALD